MTATPSNSGMSTLSRRNEAWSRGSVNASPIKIPGQRFFQIGLGMSTWLDGRVRHTETVGCGSSTPHDADQVQQTTEDQRHHRWP
jgi:hypothetical protein